MLLHGSEAVELLCLTGSLESNPRMMTREMPVDNKQPKVDRELILNNNLQTMIQAQETFHPEYKEDLNRKSVMPVDIFYIASLTIIYLRDRLIF